MMLWVFILLAGIVAVPLVIEITRKPLTDSARVDAPGSFANLPQGKTHYRWSGPENGPVCICIHGLTTPSFVWEGLTPQLVEMGFRVLTYDHIGRGYSDHAVGRQTPEFFVEHLNDLLQNQRIDDDLTVIGYSMGGAVTAAFAAENPLAVQRVILLAPAGMNRLGDGFLRFMIQTPIIGTWLMLAIYPTVLRRGIEREKHLESSVPNITALQDEELDWRGFVPAVLSSLRHMLNSDLRPAHEAIGREGIPVLAIWGRDDDVIPVSAADTLAQWNDGSKNAVIDDAGHGLTYTHTGKVAAFIKQFVGDTS